MIGFDERLARTVAALAGAGLLGGTAACGEGDDTGGTEDLGALCDGATPPADYYLALGFVTVPPGTACPDPADAQLEVNGCTFYEWQGITCGLDHVATDQVYVNDGYGGHFANSTTASTGTGTTEGPVVDVCYYEGVFYQDPDHPTCGRPLVVDGAPVVAPVHGRAGGWTVGRAPDTDALSSADREAVGRYWLQAAAMEHASIASFSHFALDLMRLGAPPELIRAAHRAALEEVTHAERCFALASGYLRRPLSPGPLAASPSGSPTLAGIAEALVREGCIGETLAAVDAAARLAEARDPAVRAALEEIVRDESAHAALAWQVVGWILARASSPDLVDRLNAVFADEAARWTAPPTEGAPVSAAARAHGLLTPSVRGAALRRGWAEVIAPAWAAQARAFA